MLSIFMEAGSLLMLVNLHSVKRLEVGISSEEDPALEEVGKRFGELVLSEDVYRHAENLVQLLQRPLLSFAIEQFHQSLSYAA